MSNTVTFKVAGNEVFSFMDKVKKDADSMTVDMINNAKRQSTVAKDQIKDIEAQIKALEKRNRLQAEAQRLTVTTQRDSNLQAAKDIYDKKVAVIESGHASPYLKEKAIARRKEEYDEKASAITQDAKDQLKAIREGERQESLQTRLLRENVDTIKLTANQQLQQMRRGNSEIVDELDDDKKREDPQWQMANQMAKDNFSKKESVSTTTGIVGGLLNIETLKSLMSVGGQLASSENGFDLIRPAAKGAGNVAGMIIGGVLGSFFGPGGTMVGAGLGGNLGGAFGDTIGAFQERRAMAAQDFLSSKYKYQATTQQDIQSIANTESIGLSASEYLQTLRQIAVNTASTATAAENTKDVLELERGAGVTKDVSSQMITYFRGTQKDISNLVGGIMSKGSKGGLFGSNDYTFLNEFLQKFNQLHNELRNTSEKVATGTTFDIMNMFNNVGGQFSSRDPRSSGLMSTINGALANPGSDSVNAASFLALRQSNPQLGIAGLLEERQKGLGSPAYLKSMLQYVDALGGGEDSKIMNTAGMFGLTGNIAAARRLYQNRDKIGTMSQSEIEEQYLGDFKGAAESKTTVLEQNMASIKNGLLSTWIDGVGAMTTAFKTAMEAAFANSTIVLSNGTINLNGGDLKTNTTKVNK